MSAIEKLTIQGIRSFGQNAEDSQLITFSSPVTLILGENGSGKTTVIECLKYALTGESPPGSDRGKNFIHDPKIFGLSETLAQIKLKVRNLNNERLSVCRSMKISHKRGKNVFETLDSTMNYDTDSISKRCADVDVAMCQFMGVSKPIINNVLLCHQEDSSWPLDEGKKLKEKFDAIFDITEYNKTIDKIIKMRKEELGDLKVKDADLRFLQHLKKEMEDKTLNIQKAQQKYDDVQEQCNVLDNDMKPIEARLLEIRNVEYEVGKHQAKRVQLETKQKNCNEQIHDMRSKIKNLFNGDLEALDREMSAFAQKMSDKRLEQQKIEKSLDKLIAEEKLMTSKYREYEKQRFLLGQQRTSEQETAAERCEKLKSMCSQLGITLDDVTSSGYDKYLETAACNPVLEEIESTMLGRHTEIMELSAQHESNDQRQQTDIDTLRVEMTKLQEGTSSLLKQKLEYETETRTGKTKIDEIEVSAKRLTKVTREIERVTKCFEELKVQLNHDDMRQKISSGKEKVSRLQQQFHKLDERLTFLNSISTLMSEISLKQKEQEKKEQEVRRVKSKHADNFRKVFNRSVESNYRRTLQVTYENLRREIKELTEKTNALKLKEQKLEIERKNVKDEVARMEKDLEESNEKIFDICHGTRFEELLSKCKETVNKYQLDHGALKSAEAMYKKYMQKIEEDPCCPICHKGMSRNEALDVTTELSDEIHQLPDNISRTELLLKAEQKKYETLLQLKPVIEKVARLESDIPKRKNDLKKIQQQLAECLSENESMQLLSAEPAANLEVASAMQGDMSLLDEAIKDVSRLREDVENLQQKLPQGSNTNESIDDIQLEKSTVAGEMESERTELETIQKEYDNSVESVNKLRDLKNELQEEQIKLQEGVQSLPQLKERQIELVKIIEEARNKIKENQNKEQPLKQKFNKAVSEKARLKDENRKTLLKLQNRLDSLKSIDQDIKRLNSEVLKFEELNLESEISKLTEVLKNSKRDLSKKSSDISEKQDTLESIKLEFHTQSALERDLKDNRELKVLEEKKTQLAEEFSELSRLLGDLDFNKVSREKNNLIKTRDDATERKGQLLGQKGEIKNQITKLQAEINEPKYKDSIQNYRRANYKVEISKRIINDLGQYRVSLEWSLMQFHKEKMEKINRLIREYWRLIYRGNDIDYIQILTNEDGIGDADRKRNYNYRVIQSKNNSEIEMRGRCSAGQRVLASLIIRMALAETFSANCGILALDEPTTNLDKMNILSLCDALNRIVEERKAQSNFMLIIITHDEDFISTLGKINSYHRVFRNDECKSVIRQVNVT